MQEKIGNGHNVEVDRFVEDLKAVVKDGQALLKAGLGSVREKARYGAETTGRYAREKPYQTIGIAFAAGVAFGILAAGMLRHSPEMEEED